MAVVRVHPDLPCRWQSRYGRQGKLDGRLQGTKQLLNPWEAADCFLPDVYICSVRWYKADDILR